MEPNLKLFLCCVLGALVYVKAQEADFNEESFKQNVNEFIKAGLGCHDNPGLTVSVVRHGKILHAEGYGSKVKDRLEPVTNRTLFGVASLSKAFAVTLMLKLMEERNEGPKEKRLSLTTKVKDILGDGIFADTLLSEYATIEDLLSHRLGIPSNNKLRLDDKLTRKDLVRRLKYLKPVGTFRSSYYYNNLIYGLATYLAEVIGGDSWENLVQTKLFDPLGMTSSTFSTIVDPSRVDRAQGYKQRKNGELVPVPQKLSKHWALLAGSGSVISNSLDMAKWMLFHLSGGRNTDNVSVVENTWLAESYKGRNSIRSPSVEKYFTKPLVPVTMSLDSYGMGWRIGQYRGFPFSMHTGSTYGVRAAVILMPKMDIGVFVAMTGEDPNFFFRTNILLYTLDLLMNEQPWLNISTVCSFPEPWMSKAEDEEDDIFPKDLSASRVISEYEGVFANEAYGEIEVYVNKTTGKLEMHYGIGKFILYPSGERDTFYGQGVGIVECCFEIPKIVFVVNGADVSLKVPSFDKQYPPIFLTSGAASISGISGSSNLLTQTAVAFLLTGFVRYVYC